jgi:hypothetical protein
MMTTGELVQAVQTRLAGLLDGDGKALFARVVVSELIERDLSYLPQTTPLPAAAVKDGDEEEAEDLAAGALTRRVVIRVGVYGLAQTKPGQGLLAVLDLAEAVRAALHRANLGRPEIVSARYLGAEASGLMEEPARLVSQKILSFRYEIEEDSDEG